MSHQYGVVCANLIPGQAKGVPHSHFVRICQNFDEGEVFGRYNVLLFALCQPIVDELIAIDVGECPKISQPPSCNQSVPFQVSYELVESLNFLGIIMMYSNQNKRLVWTHFHFLDPADFLVGQCRSQSTRSAYSSYTLSFLKLEII